MKCLLDQAIQRTRNAQDAYPALQLRYLHLAHRSRHVFTRQQSLLYPRPVRLQPGLQLQNRKPIDSRRSFVFHHPLVGAHHVAAFQRSFQKSLRCFRFRFSTSRRTSLRTNHGPRQAPPVYLRAGLTCVSFCFSDSHRVLLSYSRVSRLALHSARAELLWPLLTSGGSSPHLAMTVALRQTTRSPRVLRTHLHAYLCRIYAATSVQVSGFASIGLLTPLRRLYPLAVRQSSALPAASSGSHLTMGTLAVRLTLPLAGCVEDLHLLVSAPCRAQSGRRQGHPCRPPTPPAVRFRNGRFLSSVSGVSFVSLTIRLLVSGHLI